MNIVEMENRILELETGLRKVQNQVNSLERELGKYATQGHLKTSEANTKNLINKNSMMINNLEQRLETISIPDDTRYYLEATEIEDFRSNYKRLIALMADAEKMYQALITYVSQFELK